MSGRPPCLLLYLGKATLSFPWICGLLLLSHSCCVTFQFTLPLLLLEGLNAPKKQANCLKNITYHKRNW
jgi:hypothetical protein